MTAFWITVVVIIVAVVVVAAVQGVNDGNKLAHGTEEQKAEVRARQAAALQRTQAARIGVLRPAVVCPHCQVAGHVHHLAVKNKKGISGGKATAAVMTGGLSMFATGLSRKEGATQATCRNCSTVWSF